MENLKIYEFKLSIEKYVRESKIPAFVKQMVLKEILRECEDQAVDCINREIEERDKLKEGN